MTELRIANWNIEWMNRWFTADDDGAPQLRRPEEVPGVTDLEGLCRRVAAVIRELDPHVLTVQEGPSRKSEMALFVRDFLGGAYAVHGPAGQGQQKLYVLIAKQAAPVDEAHRITAEHGLDFEDAWEVDIDRDLVLDDYRFTRPPLVMNLALSGGKTVRLITVHQKSKYVHNGAAMWRDPARRRDFVEMALKARQRISAEAMRIRAYLDRCFDADPEARIVVTGDFNDGPGLDYFEKHYLTHNVASMVAGGPFQPARMLRHGFVDQVDKADNWTAEFDDFVAGETRRVLLDHIFVSPSLYWIGMERAVHGEIAHDALLRQAQPDASGERERLPSDHRPQTVTLTV